MIHPLLDDAASAPSDALVRPDRKTSGLRPKHVLVVDDEPDIVEVIRYNLLKEGFAVSAASTGEEALRRARETRPDVVSLDLMLPGLDGLDVCRLLKGDRGTEGVRVIVVSARGDEADVVRGLELGADDYLAKPFSPKVLCARVKSVLRRPGVTQEEKVLEAGGVRLDPRRHQCVVDGVPVDLTPTEFRLLRLLMSQRGWVLTRSRIVDGVHGDDYPVTDRSVDVQVVGLRRKLGPYQGLVETVRGVGYRFRDPEA